LVDGGTPESVALEIGDGAHGKCSFDMPSLPHGKRGHYGNAPEYERKSDGSWQCPKMTEEPKLAWWARNKARAAAKMPNVSGGSKAKRKTPTLGKPSSPKKNCSGDTAMNNCPNPKIKRTASTQPQFPRVCSL